MSEFSVTIIMPTFQRPDDLLVATRSLFRQTLLEKTKCVLIIVDNDPAASAAQSMARLKEECPDTLTLICVHEPRAGVANARNRAIDLIETDLIAFLDDDQSAGSPDWLEKLYNLYTDLKPTVTFGPVKTALPETVTDHHDYFQKFFGRTDPAPRGYTTTYHGGSNTLIDFAQLPKTRPLFDASTNESGGEDDLLFEMIREAGGTFAWAPDAYVYERVPVRRANLGYTLRRALIYGQSPTNLALKDKQYHKMLLWMGIGAGKALWHGTRAAFGFLLRTDNRVEQLDLAMRGLGKILFWKRFDLYGAPALRDPTLIRQDKVTAAPGD